MSLVWRGALALTQLTARTLSLPDGGDEQAGATVELTAQLGNGHADHAALLVRQVQMMNFVLKVMNFVS